MRFLSRKAAAKIGRKYKESSSSSKRANALQKKNTKKEIAAALSKTNKKFGNDIDANDNVSLAEYSYHSANNDDDGTTEVLANGNKAQASEKEETRDDDIKNIVAVKSKRSSPSSSPSNIKKLLCFSEDSNAKKLQLNQQKEEEQQQQSVVNSKPTSMVANSFAAETTPTSTPIQSSVHSRMTSADADNDTDRQEEEEEEDAIDGVIQEYIPPSASEIRDDEYCLEGYAKFLAQEDDGDSLSKLKIKKLKKKKKYGFASSIADATASTASMTTAASCSSSVSALQQQRGSAKKPNKKMKRKEGKQQTTKNASAATIAKVPMPTRSPVLMKQKDGTIVATKQADSKVKAAKAGKALLKSANEREEVNATNNQKSSTTSSKAGTAAEDTHTDSSTITSTTSALPTFRLLWQDASRQITDFNSTENSIAATTTTATTTMASKDEQKQQQQSFSNVAQEFLTNLIVRPTWTMDDATSATRSTSNTYPSKNMNDSAVVASANASETSIAGQDRTTYEEGVEVAAAIKNNGQGRDVVIISDTAATMAARQSSATTTNDDPSLDCGDIAKSLWQNFFLVPNQMMLQNDSKATSMTLPNNDDGGKKRVSRGRAMAKQAPTTLDGKPKIGKAAVRPNYKQPESHDETKNDSAMSMQEAVASASTTVAANTASATSATTTHTNVKFAAIDLPSTSKLKLDNTRNDMAFQRCAARRSHRWMRRQNVKWSVRSKKGCLKEIREEDDSVATPEMEDVSTATPPSPPISAKMLLFPSQFRDITSRSNAKAGSDDYDDGLTILTSLREGCSSPVLPFEGQIYPEDDFLFNNDNASDAQLSYDSMSGSDDYSLEERVEYNIHDDAELQRPKRTWVQTLMENTKQLFQDDEDLKVSLLTGSFEEDDDDEDDDSSCASDVVDERDDRYSEEHHPTRNRMPTPMPFQLQEQHLQPPRLSTLLAFDDGSQLPVSRSRSM